MRLLSTILLAYSLLFFSPFFHNGSTVSEPNLKHRHNIPVGALLPKNGTSHIQPFTGFTQPVLQSAMRFLPDNNTVYTLPVVVHIINTNPAAVTDKQVTDAINDLNDAFGKTGNYAPSKGVDTKIKFCLAQTDPDGGTTNGITRTTYFFGNDFNPDIEETRLKGLIQWPSTKYINIWYIVNMHHEISAVFKCGVWNRLNEGGFATLPPNAGTLDGIVVTDFGAMLAHEMGHYLNLLHTFEGGCNNYNCQLDGDQVCDTPPEDLPNSSSSNCNFPGNSCLTDTLSGFTIDMPDPIDNFMDYGNSACHNSFTQGQADRMRAAIVNLRSSLLQNECDKPCAENSVAAFTRNNPYPLPGDLVSFTNNSSGVTNYQWLVNDVVIATTQNFSYTFNKIGKYKITLKAYNGDASCFAAYTDYVTVTCGVTARFFGDKVKVASKAGIALDSIVFINKSENATSYKWLIGNNTGMAEQIVSTNKNLTYVFLTPGNYTIRLIASNGSCSDTTEIFRVPVADPTQDGVLYIYNAYCYQQTKVQVSFYVCNNGYATIPYGTPISFYDGDPRLGNAKKIAPTFYLPSAIQGLCCGYLYSQIIDVDPHTINQLYVAFNDSGKVVPLKYPNTPMVELSYLNNISYWSGSLAFKAYAAPPTATVAYGDTLQLTSYGSPYSVSSYKWFPTQNLGCPYCQSTYYIGDTTIKQGVVLTTQYGCFDTAYSNIKVLPSDNFSIVLDSVECAAGDSLQVNFTLSNLLENGIIPQGLKAAFFNSNPTLVGAVLLAPSFTVLNDVNAGKAAFSTTIKGTGVGNLLFGAVNDNGAVIPIKFANTIKHERDYTNNIGSITYTRLKTTVLPTLATLEPGDTLQLYAKAAPGNIVSYLWSNATNLSCTLCDSTTFIAADYNETKQVTVTNNYGCTDTASVIIKVPPANDYSILFNDIKCSAGDSLHVNFSLFNSFKRGVIPKNLTVAFYNADPTTGNAALLPPIFTVKDTVKLKQASFVANIKGISLGNVYAVVNDSGATSPLQLPNIINLPEKDYTNNMADTLFQPQQILLKPADTTIMRKTSFAYAILTPLINPSSTVWDNSNNYTLNCYNCIAPIINVLYKDTVRMQTANEYGCMVKGKAVVKILPADMTIDFVKTECYSNSTTRVTFKMCMNNNYDSVFAQVPVSFYDSQPIIGGPAKLLSPVFYTPKPTPGNCDTFSHIIQTPTTHKIYAVVNDKGDNAIIPNPAYAETDFTNNFDNTPVVPFNVMVSPADTSVIFNQSAVLSVTSAGSAIGSATWSPTSFLSCTNCVSTVVTPTANYTRYMCVVQSEYNCIDTVYATVKTLPGWGIHIPTAFTPNGDGLNDVFYVLGGKELSSLADFAIYNRWGKRCFYVSNVLPNNPASGWDGKVNGEPAPSGTYVYLFNAKFSDGTVQKESGTFILIR